MEDWEMRMDLEEKLAALMEKHKDEYMHFELVQPKLSQRADLHAFMLLDKLVPGTQHIISFAGHDETSLSVKPYQLMSVASEDQIIELIRCGVNFDQALILLTFCY